MLFLHEWKINLKSFLVWLISVGGMVFCFLLMYSSVEGSLENLGDLFSNMGPMSQIFGMDRLSINTLTGYYATEIAMVQSLGVAMFAAIIGSNMLSKEEFGHTIEFLGVLPITRVQIIIQKYISMISMLFVFQFICTSLCVLGFNIMGEEIVWEHFITLFLTQLIMVIEISTICFCISAFSGKNMMGIGLGVALILFAVDMMCRIVPAMEKTKYLTPFYYSNATDIFTNTDLNIIGIIVGILIMIISFVLSIIKYNKKDFSA